MRDLELRGAGNLLEPNKVDISLVWVLPVLPTATSEHSQPQGRKTASRIRAGLKLDFVSLDSTKSQNQDLHRLTSKL